MKKFWCSLLACSIALSCALFGCGTEQKGSGEKPIKVGLLYSLSGVTSVSEKQLYNGTKLAIDEINQNGGINGRKIETVFADYASDPARAADKARKLILDDKVVAIVGTCSSSARKAVKPVVESNHSLLVYPQSYEGQEQSKNIVYVGCIPNQQAEVFVDWLVKNVGISFIRAWKTNWPRHTSRKTEAPWWVRNTFPTEAPISLPCSIKSRRRTRT